MLTRSSGISKVLLPQVSVKCVAIRTWSGDCRALAEIELDRRQDRLYVKVSREVIVSPFVPRRIYLVRFAIFEMTLLMPAVEPVDSIWFRSRSFCMFGCVGEFVRL